MELKSEYKINASRETVFAALNDPEILRQCIPGCESLEKESDSEMSATVALKIGPVKAKFKGKVELSNLVPPESYSIAGEGAGGAAGYAKGGAHVKLVEDDAGTLLQYEVEADVGGRLAQLGGRLIDSTARTLSGKFFQRFGELVESEDETGAPEPQPETAPSGGKKWIWIAAGIAILIAAASIVISNN